MRKALPGACRNAGGYSQGNRVAHARHHPAKAHRCREPIFAVWNGADRIISYRSQEADEEQLDIIESPNNSGATVHVPNLILTNFLNFGHRNGEHVNDPAGRL